MAENLQQGLLREVGEGGGAGLGRNLLLERAGGAPLCRHGVALSTCEVGEREVDVEGRVGGGMWEGGCGGRGREKRGRRGECCFLWSSCYHG